MIKPPNFVREKSDMEKLIKGKFNYQQSFVYFVSFTGVKGVIGIDNEAYRLFWLRQVTLPLHPKLWSTWILQQRW